MIKSCRSHTYGKFSCKLTENLLTLQGSEHRLLFFGKKSENDTYFIVPDFMLPEAKKLARRGSGDKLLDFAYLLAIHEAALARKC